MCHSGHEGAGTVLCPMAATSRGKVSSGPLRSWIHHWTDSCVTPTHTCCRSGRLGGGLLASVLMTAPIWLIRRLDLETPYHIWTVYHRGHDTNFTWPASRHVRPSPGADLDPAPEGKARAPHQGADRRGRDRPGRHPRPRPAWPTPTDSTPSRSAG